MRNETAERGIADRYAALVSLMDERMRRQWAAAEAQSYGWGGISAVTRAIGMSHTTIAKGMAELDARAARPDAPVKARLRKKGAEPKPLTLHSAAARTRTCELSSAGSGVERARHTDYPATRAGG